MKYEDLATSHQTIVKQLYEWLGVVNIDLKSIQNFRTIANHAIAGNPMRWETTEIRLDQKWARSLPRLNTKLVWLITNKLAKSYAYHKQYSID